MKVFITGATGVLGKRVVNLLTSKNIEVVALSRSSSNAQLLKTTGAEVRQANLFNQAEIIEATKGCDAILHLATAIPQKTMPKMSDWELNDRIRIDGTRNLVEAALINKIQIFICEGNIALYGQQDGKYITSETIIPEDQVRMVASAVTMERIIHEKLADRFLILRFGLFYSADSFHTRDMITNVSKGKMPMLGDGAFYSNFIHIDDAASAIVFGLENFARLKGHAIDITDFKPILFSEYLEKLSAFTGGKKPFRLPFFWAKLFLGKHVFAFLTNSYRIRQDSMFKEWTPQHPDVIAGMREIVMQRTASEK